MVECASALDELHGADGTEEEDRGHHQGMDSQPPVVGLEVLEVLKV